MSAPGKSRLIALIVACAMFMAQLDGAVVALALPSMSHSFGVPPVELSAGISVYLMVQVILLPTGGWVSERFGGRRVFATAIFAFTMASVLCAMSSSFATFLIARILQGCAAAFMAPVGRIVLLENTAKRDLVSVMTISTVPMLVAPSVGPALGGFITTYWSWPWIFLLNVPFGVLGFVVALRLIPKTPPKATRPFDLSGFLLFAGSSSLVLYGLQRLVDDAAARWAACLMMAAGLLLSLPAVHHARHHPHPLVSLAPVAIPSFFIGAIGGGSLIRLPIRSLPFLLPMMFQLCLGMSALRAGILMLSLNGGDLLLKVITRSTLRRYGFRTVLLVTTALSAVSMACCAIFSATTGFTIMLAVLLLSGMFRSLLFTGLSTLVFADVPQSELAHASILWNIMQQLTNVLGVSLSALLLTISASLAGETGSRLSLHDFRVALLVMAALGVSALLSLRRLAPNAGAAVSGHEAGSPSQLTL